MFKWLLILLVFIAFDAGAQERRFIIWNKNEVAVQPWNKITIGVAEKIHYSPDKNSVEVKYGELNVGREEKKWLEYGAAFRFTYLNLQDGDWLNEKRPMIFVTFSEPINAFELSFSNRFEYRIFEDFDDYFRYRQALKLSFPSLTSWGMSFYLLEESFFKMNGDGTHLARFYSGLTAFDKKHFEMKFYYSLEKAKASNTWFTADILGVNLSFSI